MSSRIRYLKIQDEVPLDQPFPCDTRVGRSKTPPTSVHKLRPGDIDVIGGMGDSLTAGNGAAALNLVQVFVNHRGMSFTAGGEATWREFLTLPNILKEFNPKLVGYAFGDSFLFDQDSQLNVAVTATLDDELLAEAQTLVARMKEDPRIDIKNHWKMISIFSGNNDICEEVCYDHIGMHSAEAHRQRFEETLDYLKEHLPRTIVNIVSLPRLRSLYEVLGKSEECERLHTLACPCIFAMKDEAKLKDTFKIVREYQKAEESLAKSSKYDVEDFSVVYQPFSLDGRVPLIRVDGKLQSDFTFMSVDCFHFSQKGYARAANALWNNLLEPVGAKNALWGPIFERFLCPSEDSPYIFTNRNSISALKTATRLPSARGIWSTRGESVK